MKESARQTLFNEFEQRATFRVINEINYTKKLCNLIICHLSRPSYSFLLDPYFDWYFYEILICLQRTSHWDTSEKRAHNGTKQSEFDSGTGTEKFRTEANLIHWNCSNVLLFSVHVFSMTIPNWPPQKDGLSHKKLINDMDPAERPFSVAPEITKQKRNRKLKQTAKGRKMCFLAFDAVTLCNINQKGII